MATAGSYWLPRQLSSRYPSVTGEVRVDVAVIGGGIVGLTAAHLLKREGKRVAVVEARQVGAQVSGHTTAKITSLHKLIYADLVRRFDEEAARRYGAANEEALRLIAATVEAEGIDCGLVRQPAYTVCFDRSNHEAVRKEAEVAARLGLPARFEADPDLPIPTKGAVSFANQAQFHPYLYMAALAERVAGDGSHVFEQTRASDVEEQEPNVVVCPEGRVLAEDVIVATNLPFLDRAGFFAMAYPRDHVAAAARLADGPGFDGMIINVEEPTRSVRWHADERGHVLIATGAAYRPAEDDPVALLAELEQWLRAHFPVADLENVWTNEDFDSMDGMPLVGNLSSKSPRVWVATGFGAWGITGGTAAAMILCDRITGRDNVYAELFDSTRLNPSSSASNFVSSTLQVAKEFVRDHLSGGERREPEDLAPGEGAILGEKIAAYRDDSGHLYTHSAKCTHMGCIVAWNPIMRTWDCPCHGSSFEADGSIRFGPALSPLSSAEE